MGIGTKHLMLSRRGLDRHFDKRQIACAAANVHIALASFKPSLRWLSFLFGVCEPYIALAIKLSPERRQAIIAGRDQTSFVTLLKAPERQLTLPKPEAISDAQLVDFVRAVGSNRVLNAAVAVEAAQ
jgi:hypothetical protein